jgi:hypothetical protein
VTGSGIACQSPPNPAHYPTASLNVMRESP